MINDLNNATSEIIGKIEKLIAIVEHLKIYIQDGLVNISDENQKKQVLDALEKFTDIQRTNFKIIQASEKLESQMNSNLKDLYSILPLDTLKSILGETSDYGDLPEDLISQIKGDEASNLENVPVDESINDVSSEKEFNQEENSLLNQIADLAPEVTSQVVTPSSDVSTDTTSEVVTPPADVSTDTTSEVVTPPSDASTDTTSEVVTPPADASTDTTSEVVTPPADASTDTTSEVVTPPVDVSNDTTSEVVTPSADVSTDTTSEVVTPPSDVSTDTTSDVVTPPADVSSELDSIVLPSLDDTSSEISTDNNTVESISSTNSEDMAVLPLSDEKSTEKTEDSSVLLPLELDNSEDNKTKSEDSNVILSLDSSNTVKEKNEDSMIAGSELVLPVLQQSLDVDADAKDKIVSLDTSPVSDQLSFISRGNPKLLAVTSKQFSNLNNSLVTQMGNPEISRVLNFPSQDTQKSSLDNVASLESDKGTDLETMMQEMEKAYDEGRVDEAERLSEEISIISNADHQKTLSLSNVA